MNFLSFVTERKGPAKWIVLPLVWLAVTAILLVMIEGVASWALAARSVAFGPPWGLHTRYDTLLGWSSEPGTVIPNAYGPGAAIRIDSRGFRGEELAEPLSPGGLRIVCSGDSFTFGEGVGNGEDWCHLLSGLNEGEAVNMGQPGYGVDQAYLWYLRDGLSLDPDVHIFAFVSGDFDRMLTPSRYGAGKPVLEVSEDGVLETRNVPVPRLRHTVGRVVDRADLRLVDLGRGFLARLIPGGPTTPRLEAIEPPASRMFEGLRDVNDEQGVTSLFVYLPTEHDIEVDFPVRAMMRSLAGRLGVAYLDLTGEMRALPARFAAELFLPDGHYTAEGNRWVAEAVTVKLREMGAIQGP